MFESIYMYLYIFLSYRHIVTSSTIPICEMEMKIYLIDYYSFRMYNYNVDLYQYCLSQHISFFRSAIKWEHYVVLFACY